MRLYKTTTSLVYIFHQDSWYESEVGDWDHLINRVGLFQYLSSHLDRWTKQHKEPDFVPAAPIGSQEVWAAGVTYLRSKLARMEEAKDAGGGDFYDKVYDADRPEIFFKATSHRTVGPGEIVYIRKDSSWNVPEPELTLFISAYGSIEGYTAGNDMSSRSIEGENPLYLPQAKSYDRSASIGPCLYLSPTPIPSSTIIEMTIHRSGIELYHGAVSIDQMKRSLEELVNYLFLECSFPKGCFLMTGTCLVPDDDFTLKVGDEIHIEIDNIGVLNNIVGINPNSKS